MKRGLNLASCTLPDLGRMAAAITLCFTMCLAPAAAQTGPQVDLYGYVAPRCWVVSAKALQPVADAPLLRPRVICNQATPALRSQVRALNADGTLAERLRPLADSRPAGEQQSGRAALEIIVSPQA